MWFNSETHCCMPIRRSQGGRGEHLLQYTSCSETTACSFRSCHAPIEHLQVIISYSSSCVQTPVRTNDLLNALQHILDPGNRPDLTKAFPGFVLSQQHAADPITDRQHEQESPVGLAASSPAASPADESASSLLQPGLLAGDDYYRAKEQLITDEQIVLRILRFEINVEHPHKYLLNICRSLQSGQPLTQLALCLVRPLHKVSAPLHYIPALTHWLQHSFLIHC